MSAEQITWAEWRAALTEHGERNRLEREISNLLDDLELAFSGDVPAGIPDCLLVMGAELKQAAARGDKKTVIDLVNAMRSTVADSKL